MVKLDAKTPLVIPGNAAIGNGPVPRPGEKRTRPYRSTTLVAVPAAAAKGFATEKELHAAVADGTVPGAVESKPLGDHANVRLNDPRKEVTNRYRVVKIDPKDGIVLEAAMDAPKPEEEEAAAPAATSRWLALGLALSAGLGFAGLWVARRRRV